MTAAQTPRPVPPSWLGAVGEASAAEALPTGGLTLIELGSADGQYGHWPTAVVPLALEVLKSGRPVFFVESGGLGDTGGGEDLAVACDSDPLLMVHKDEDVVVYAPPSKRSPRSFTEQVTVDGRPYYSCYVPTLRNIERDLQSHDSEHGTSMVIFDDVEMIRPYFDVTDDGGFSPLRLPVQQAHGWRATDLLSFAETRPTPTLLVSERPAQFNGRRALLDVSLAHAVVLRTADGGTVEVSFARRATLSERWPRPCLGRVHIYDR